MEKLTMEQIIKSGFAFNPLASDDGQGQLYLGKNQGRLAEAMREFGWKDMRFLPEEQIKEAGWELAKEANPVELFVHGNDGGWQSEKVFNGSEIIGMPPLEVMREDAMRARNIDLASDDELVITAGQEWQKSRTFYTLAGVSDADAVGGVRYGIGAISSEEEIIQYALAECAREGVSLNELAGVADFGPGEEFAAAVRKLNDAGRVFEVYDSEIEKNLYVKRVQKLVDLGLMSTEQEKKDKEEELEVRPDDRKLSWEGDEVLTKPMVRVQAQDSVLDQRVTPEYVPVLMLGRLFKENVPGSGEYFRKGEMKRPAFVDKGDSVVVKDKKPDSYHAVLELAKGKGWEQIELSGKPENVAKVWIEAQLMGIGVTNFVPSEKDLTALEKRRAEVAKENAAREAEMLNTPPKGVKLVEKGQFVGEVKEIVNNFVIQDAGRGNLVAHKLENFEKAPAVGAVLELKYERGGKIREVERGGVGLERGGR